MPLYEYECDICDAVTELVRAVADRDKPATCPECGGAMHRQVSAFASFRFRQHGRRGYDPDAAAGPETVKEELCYG